MRRRLLPLAVVSMLFVLRAGNADCQFSQKAKLNARGGAAGDNFGFSLALSANGGTSLVGAYEKNAQRGSAYVFTRSGPEWKEQQELAAPESPEPEAFGWSVALSGDGGTALIGAMGKDKKRGAAYVFTRAGAAWTRGQELKASDGTAGDNFAFSVALSADGSTALIGAPAANSFLGRAYIFKRIGSTWVQKQELTNPDGSANEEFASSVALSADGGTVLVGAYEKNAQRGSAYVFTRSGSEWKEQQELAAPESPEP